MLTAFLAHLAGWFIKMGLAISHIKFQVALFTGDIHHIVSHYKYVETFRLARPFLSWNPF